MDLFMTDPIRRMEEIIKGLKSELRISVERLEKSNRDLSFIESELRSLHKLTKNALADFNQHSLF